MRYKKLSGVGRIVIKKIEENVAKTFARTKILAKANLILPRLQNSAT